MARIGPHLAGVGAVVALALLMAGDLSGWAESTAPASAGAKPNEKVAEKEKAVEKAAHKPLPAVHAPVPLPLSLIHI